MTVDGMLNAVLNELRGRDIVVVGAYTNQPLPNPNSHIVGRDIDLRIIVDDASLEGLDVTISTTNAGTKVFFKSFPSVHVRALRSRCIVIDTSVFPWSVMRDTGTLLGTWLQDAASTELLLGTTVDDPQGRVEGIRSIIADQFRSPRFINARMRWVLQIGLRSLTSSHTSQSDDVTAFWRFAGRPLMGLGHVVVARALLAPSPRSHLRRLREASTMLNAPHINAMLQRMWGLDDISDADLSFAAECTAHQYRALCKRDSYHDCLLHPGKEEYWFSGWQRAFPALSGAERAFPLLYLMVHLHRRASEIALPIPRSFRTMVRRWIGRTFWARKPEISTALSTIHTIGLGLLEELRVHEDDSAPNI